MYDYEKIFKSANLQSIAQGASHQACNCIGPQNGQPACPCAMRDVKVIDGRYVRTQDLGPANPHGSTVRFGGIG